MASVPGSVSQLVTGIRDRARIGTITGLGLPHARVDQVVDPDPMAVLGQDGVPDGQLVAGRPPLPRA